MARYDDLSSRDLLVAAEANVRGRRAVEVERLDLVLAWCDRHGAAPVKDVPGGPSLEQVGGDGSPGVVDLCLGEFAIAQQVGYLAIRNLAADALDLRHRLPLLNDRVRAYACEAWVARKIAAMSRRLTRDAVRLVDAAVAAAVRESPSRLLAIAEAKIIEADPVAHRAKLTADAHDTGVWLGRPRLGTLSPEGEEEPATRRISAKLPHGAALHLDATLDDLADALASQATDEDAETTRAQWRAQAMELLARPREAAALLAEDPVDDEGAPPRQRRSAVIHVHISALALIALTGGTDGAIARVEGLGPMLLDQLAELLHRRDLTLQPVLDLSTIERVNHYEHPTRIRERILTRIGRDVFPHAGGTTTSTGSRLDLDHVTEYRPHGPPGQTGDHNTAPLNRTHHRMKTHLAYQVTQLAPDDHRWRTPHGLTRVVTAQGTRTVELLQSPDGNTIGEFYYVWPADGPGPLAPVGRCT